jgi:DNA invertase Pin-like site-specific DNA recombinase
LSGTKTRSFVCYYRVSTQRQGRSGLGLAAQQEAVRNYLNGGGWRIVGEFTEIESGKRKDRPKLMEALAACRLYGAKLIIAKLDRLARNVAFTSNLMESGVDFEAVDFPQANRLTIHILAAVAEHEARAISERTKAALAATKKKLGGYRPGAKLTPKAREAGSAAVARMAAQRAADIGPTIAELRTKGATSLRAIAAGLNERRIPTARGGGWTATQVMRLVKRGT